MKTDSSAAVMPLGDSLVDALRDHQREQQAARMRSQVWLDADLTFTTTVGTALEPRAVNRAWNRVCERAAVDCAHIHDLRHACGTYLADEGLRPKATQAALRHSRMATTEIYVHALAEAMDRVVADLRTRRVRPRALLWRRLGEAGGPAGLRRRFDLLVDEAGLDADLARGWTLLRAVDYQLWGLNLGLTEDPALCATVIDWLSLADGPERVA